MSLDAITDVKTEAQWNDKPAGRWLGARRTSLLPSGTRDNIGQALKGPLLPAEQQSNAGDGVISKFIRDRSTKFQAPTALEPTGKVTTKAQAISDFEARRAKSLESVQTTQCAARAWRRHAPDQRLPTGPDAQRAHRTSYRPVARSESLTWVSQELSRRVNQSTETIADICGYRGTTSQRILFLANI